MSLMSGKYAVVAMTVTVLLAGSGQASAKPLTVNAQDNIYGAGQTSAPGGGNVPAAVVKLSGKPACVTVKRVLGSVSCSEKSGCVILNVTSGNTPNDADGKGAATATSSNTGSGAISGITAPLAGYLVGLFTKTGAPTGNPPPALDFTHIGTGFTTLSPAINQSFFVGDGRVGDGTGAAQTFNVPAGAKRLYFGISDACNYNGGPGCYDDNQGSYTLTAKVTAGACD